MSNRKTKPHHCKKCNETDPQQFYKGSKSKCKKCICEDLHNHYIEIGEEGRQKYREGRLQRYHSFSPEEKQRVLKQQKDWRTNSLLYYRFLSARCRARVKGIPFELTMEILEDKLRKQGNRCYFSKMPFDFCEDSWYTISIDRKDSSLGYTVENTVLVTKFVNSSKNNLNADDYKRHIIETAKGLSNFSLIL